MLTDKFFVIAEVGHDVTLWILVALSVFSLAFILERWITLSKIGQSSNKAADKIRETLQSNDLSFIEKMSQDWDTLEGRGLSFGLKHAEKNGVDGLEEIFHTYMLTEKPRLEKRLNFLATVGSNAPFIGLLGTVFGIMDAFRGLAQSQGDASAVMIGISKALVATAIGLLVAIPAVVAYNAYQKKVKRVLANLEGIRDICIAYAKTKRSGGN
ncbi:MAG: MotA/TolQ/ExbB proton channel family protein [Bdellovibrionales bacterium]|nr:MotA/TolQ/ExbB proton channel family protein [Bdellovibrionales bacterium]